MIIALGILVLLVFIYVWFVEPAELEVRKESIEYSGRSPLSILFVSDLHVGTFNSTSLLHKKIDKLFQIHQSHPFDMVLFGGDFLDRGALFLPKLVATIEKFSQWNIPLYGVLGNHDLICFPQTNQLIKAFAKSGLTILDNQAELVSINGQKFVIIGLRDLEELPGYSKGIHDYSATHYQAIVAKSDWYSQFDHYHCDLPRILLGHNPDSVYLPGRNPDMVLSGHTHGGQIILLRWFGHLVKWMMPRGSFVSWSGKAFINTRVLLVSRGLSGSLFPARFLSKPDAIHITMHPQKTPQALVIGLSGKPRSGKDTASDMFESLFPGITRLTFGSAIKAEYDALHGTNTLADHEEKFAHRDAINEFGASKRSMDKNYWIKKTITTNPPILITDVRQPQEVNAVHEAGGVLIRIEADLETLRQRAGDHAHLLDGHVNHEQESHLDEFGKWDYVIHNNGSLKDLEENVREISQEIRNRYNS